MSIRATKATADPEKFRALITGQVRRITAAISREMKRRAGIEPVIGHLKAEHRMDRNYLMGHHGDRINAVRARRQLQLPSPAQVGRCNLACLDPDLARRRHKCKTRLNYRSSGFFTDDLLTRPRDSAAFLSIPLSGPITS